MHWVRQIFSSSWTCILLIVNNSKCCFKAYLVIQQFLRFGKWLQWSESSFRMKAIEKKGICLSFALMLKSFHFSSLCLKSVSHSPLLKSIFIFKCVLNVAQFLLAIKVKGKYHHLGAKVEECIYLRSHPSDWRWMYEHVKCFYCVEAKEVSIF